MHRNQRLAVLLALLAAPAFARVAEWAMPSFISRCSTTAEAVIADFSTFEMPFTLLLAK